MPTRARAERLRQQIAYLKVLMAEQEDHLRAANQQVAAYTRLVLTCEASVGTFAFRIEEFEAELAAEPRRATAKGR